MSIFICFELLLIMASVNGLVTINTVYYEMPPFIYSKNGTLEGVFPDIARQAKQLCNLDINFTNDIGNASDFTSLVNDEQRNLEMIEDNWLWLSLVEWFPKETLDRLMLKQETWFHSPGMEVVVHRNQIGILPKIKIGATNCRYLLYIAFVLAVIFGILIWLIVRHLQTPKAKNLLLPCQN